MWCSGAVAEQWQQYSGFPSSWNKLSEQLTWCLGSSILLVSPTTFSSREKGVHPLSSEDSWGTSVNYSPAICCCGVKIGQRQEVTGSRWPAAVSLCLHFASDHWLMNNWSWAVVLDEVVSELMSQWLLIGFLLRLIDLLSNFTLHLTVITIIHINILCMCVCLQKCLSGLIFCFNKKRNDNVQQININPLI